MQIQIRLAIALVEEMAKGQPKNIQPAGRSEGEQQRLASDRRIRDMRAEISMGGLIFVAFILVVWGAIAISSIKAAKNSQVTRVAPPPLASGQGYERRVLPKVGPVGVRQTGVRQTGGLPRRPIPGVAVP